MRRIIAILLILSLLALVSCGKNEDTTQGNQNDSYVADTEGDSEESSSDSEGTSENLKDSESDSEENKANGSQDSEIHLPKDEF